MTAQKGCVLPSGDRPVAPGEAPHDEDTSSEFLALLTATHYYAKKWEAERGKGSIHYVKVIGTLIYHLQTELKEK